MARIRGNVGDPASSSPSGGPKGIERGEHCNDRRFVIAGGAREHPPFRIKAVLDTFPRDHRPAGLDHSASQSRFPWGTGPVGGLNRLSVEMRVDQDGRLRAIVRLRGVNVRGAIILPDGGLETARIELAHDPFGIPDHVAGCICDVGQAQQGPEILEDLMLVFDAVGLCGTGCIVGLQAACTKNRRETERSEESDACRYAHLIGC